MLVSRTFKFAGVLLLSSAAAVASASPAVVDFNTLPGLNGTPFTSYTQAGFTIAGTAGHFFVGGVFGNPEPSLFAGSVVNSPSAAVTITHTGGGDFYFDGFQMASNLGSTAYTVTGSLDGSSIFSLSGTLADTHLTWQMIATQFQNDFIDSATLSFIGSGTSFNVDNIELSTPDSTSAVPEPSSVLLLGSGVAALAIGLRRRLAL